jgi:hypothetical protein
MGARHPLCLLDTHVFMSFLGIASRIEKLITHRGHFIAFTVQIIKGSLIMNRCLRGSTAQCPMSLLITCLVLAQDIIELV